MPGTKGAAKVIDPKDISPAWKILKMKLNEEKQNEARENPLIDEDGFTKVLSKTQKKRLNRKRKAQEALQSAAKEAEASKKASHHDIPVLIKDNERGEPTHIVAIDCEYVGGGSDGKSDILARISIVNDKGHIVYDKYVKPTEKVTDYRTAISGIRPDDLKKGIPFDKAQTEVSKLLEGRIVVGHAVHNDFRVLKLTHGRKLTRDTAKCSIFKNRMEQHRGTPSLKRLAKEVLGIEIQRGEHDSITDARVALRLYESVKKQWEAELKRFRK
ncbi:unnamed protein product [Caenorhabditis bovis]|uniref:RNA exonuclease 4 n=1 Tax=Caenorhabditis bovis TaxID=2654633 RepID=A0A8S1EQZ9_9PELO|nr:unnamed protein product [Caenorhabditis bovis]